MTPKELLKVRQKRIGEKNLRNVDLIIEDITSRIFTELQMGALPKTEDMLSFFKFKDNIECSLLNMNVSDISYVKEFILSGVSEKLKFYGWIVYLSKLNFTQFRNEDDSFDVINYVIKVNFSEDGSVKQSKVITPTKPSDRQNDTPTTEDKPTFFEKFKNLGYRILLTFFGTKTNADDTKTE